MNCLILEGPTGSGKSLTLNGILSKLNTAIMTRSGDATQFYYQNLLGKTYAMFEEPRIGIQRVDDYKLLLEGATMEIDVKHNEPEKLERIPIFISTNKPIDFWVDVKDGAALRNRCKTFKLTKEIKGMANSYTSQSLLDPPPGRITPADFLAILKKYGPHTTLDTIEEEKKDGE